MLKIKDNVDLKELEKFGFVLEGTEYSYYGDKNTDYDVLFDLIQAGFVEKVVER